MTKQVKAIATENRHTVVANAIVDGVRRVLASVHGVKSVEGVSPTALLHYAKRAGMLEPEEVVICQGVFGYF